jgi:hypothetical protein
MICVGIVWLSSISVPAGDLFPGLAAVFGTVQIYATTNDVIRICRMHHDGVAVRDLSFVAKVRSMNAFPIITAVGTTEDSEQKIVVAAGFILRECVEHIRIGRADGQAGAAKGCGGRQTLRQMLPLFPRVH